jgi:hypothetical protein
MYKYEVSLTMDNLEFAYLGTKENLDYVWAWIRKHYKEGMGVSLKEVNA